MEFFGPHTKHRYSEAYFGSARIYKAVMQMHFPWVKRVLDVGTGEGRAVQLYRDAGFEAYGLEIQPFKAPGMIYANAFQMPFRDNTFDAVSEIMLFADFVEFCDMGEIEIIAAMEEIKRVLRPGGLFFHGSRDHGLLKELFSHTNYPRADHSFPFIKPYDGEKPSTYTYEQMLKKELVPELPL